MPNCSDYAKNYASTIGKSLSAVLSLRNIFQETMLLQRKRDMIKLRKNIRKIMQSTKKIGRDYLIGRNRKDEIKQSLRRILKTQTKP